MCVLVLVWLFGVVVWLVVGLFACRGVRVFVCMCARVCLCICLWESVLCGCPCARECFNGFVFGRLFWCV